MIKFCSAAACLIALLALSWAGDKPSIAASKLERGKYLVEGVGLCGDCHTPHNEKGEPVTGQKLQGATIAFSPTVPVPVWAGKAPAIAGLTGLNNADVISLLSAGQTTRGIRPRPPMPGYRLSKQDAEAVVMYLRSLGPASEKKATR